jgi:O-antigen/teichoic acid export membrane protein
VSIVAIIMALGLGALCLAATTLAFPFLQDSIFQNVPYSYLLVALLLVPTAIYQIYWNYMMIGLNRILLMNKLNMVVNTGSTVMMVLTVGVLQLGIPGFLLTWSAGSVLGALGALVLAVRVERPLWPVKRKAVGDILGFGLRSHGANISHHLFLRIDAYMVNAMVSTRAVGFYTLSTSLAEKLWLPLNAIHTSSISKIAQLPRAESALLTAKIARTALLMMLGIAIPFAVVSVWLVPFLYGGEFIESVPPLIILLGGVLCFAVMMVLNSYILGQMERPGLLSIIGWVELSVSVPLYVLMISWLGIVGAAIASSITYALATAGTLFIFMRDSQIGLRQLLVPRRADFQDYARVLRTIRSRLPV